MAGLRSNAHAVSRLLGEQGVASVASPAPQLVEAIDALVSLYAVQELDAQTVDAIKELGRKPGDQKGLEFVTSYLIGQRVDELKKIGTNRKALFNHFKGHIPSEVQQGGAFEIRDETDHAYMISRGYTKVSEYEGSSADRSLGRKSYYYAPVSGLAAFSQGVLQTVHQTVSGINPETGYSVGEIMAGRIEDPATVRAIQRQLANQRPTNENLLPVFNEAGRLVAFERAADPAKLANLNRSTDLSMMIGVWRGRQVEELLAQKVNEELVDNLKTIWDKGLKEGRKNEFVNIASLGSSTDDRILIEAANLIPNQTRDYIKDVFGENTFMVRRDMLLDTFGARNASVGDLFTGKTRWNPTAAKEFELIATGIFGNYAYAGMVSAEKNIQEFITNAKTMIVVKSVIVPVANLVSNMFQLMNRGVPLRAILKGAGAKTAELNSYIKRRDQEVELEAELRAASGKTWFLDVQPATSCGIRMLSIPPSLDSVLMHQPLPSPRNPDYHSNDLGILLFRTT